MWHFTDCGCHTLGTNDLWELLKAGYGLYGVLGALHSVLVSLSQAAVSPKWWCLIKWPLRNLCPFLSDGKHNGVIHVEFVFVCRIV